LLSCASNTDYFSSYSCVPHVFNDDDDDGGNNNNNNNNVFHR